ncbi:MAG: ComEC/Rec2 family competence protein [Yoonia sp.]|uniref:ComEC/Rec2 family competence protein n=1 Tax=Yoonia sp. TaxID=2212373 RepID=UPI003EF2C463
MRLRGEGQVRTGIQDLLLQQRDSLFCWMPVCLGTGIGLYFALGQEPDTLALLCGGVAALVLLVGWYLAPPAAAPLLMGLVLVLGGVGVAKWRTDSVAAPVLEFRYYGPIQGRVVNIDRSSSDAIRLTLDRVVLARMSPQRTPERVRVSLHGDYPSSPFSAGDVVMTTGHLSPPAGPAEPGGFDFQRHAWFMKLGAVGYTRTPVVKWAAADNRAPIARIFALRMGLSAAVQAAIPGDVGAFAAAIMTGDRAGMSQDVLADLRASNLAHLLAISGLHMGLLTGFVFALVRYGLALIPLVALRWQTKKIAAVCALVVGVFYLALSGGNVATERAFIMVSVMFVAVLLDRRALTLRAVAIAAMIVLVWQPESLVGPGFQMSFAATTALVAAFAGLRRLDLTRLPRWTRPIWSVVLSSLVAGLATAPFAAAHFNQFAHYGLIANLLSVPLMGVLVMPAAVLATCLAPFGLSGVGFWLMEQGLRWILFVADTVASRADALSHILAPHWSVLPALSLGLLGALLLRGPVRSLGLVATVCAAIIWGQTNRPALLVADNGSLIGLQTPQGRHLSKMRGSGFVAGIWLENDGNPVPQEVAADRTGLQIVGRQARATLGAWQVLQVSGKTALAELVDCGGADILITNQTDGATRPCRVFDIVTLRDTGALAIGEDVQGRLVIQTAHHAAGARPWNAQQGPRGAAIILATKVEEDPQLTQFVPDQ